MLVKNVAHILSLIVLYVVHDDTEIVYDNGFAVINNVVQ